MKLTVIRLGDNGDATIGAFYINGVFKCFTIEDQEQKGEKIRKETRVPEGRYEVKLRAEGGKHAKYAQKYPKIHKGMLCISNRPGWFLENDGHKFQFILIHVGNTDAHTEGCLLLNYGADALSFRGSNSGNAYQDLYPEIAAACEVEEVLITYIDMEDGK